MGGHAEEGALAPARLLGFREQPLRLLQQFLGAHVHFDGVEHDPDTLHQPVQEVEGGGAEGLDGGQLQDCLQPALEDGRHHHHIHRGGLAQAGAHPDVRVGHRGQDDPLAVQGGLPDQSLPHPELFGRLAGRIGVGRRQPQHRVGALGRLQEVEGAVLRAHQRRHFRQDEPGHRRQIAVPLQHLRMLGQVGLEPVLLGVLLGGLL